MIRWALEWNWNYTDKVLEGSRCDFESGWCGWTNTHLDDLDWTRHNGSTPTVQTGPSHDNTYKNSTGMYLFVDMSETKDIGNSAFLQSPRFPPPPKYHSNPASPFFNSCQVTTSYFYSYFHFLFFIFLNLFLPFQRDIWRVFYRLIDFFAIQFTWYLDYYE